MWEAQAKSMKGQGLALHGCKPHLHILIRIDRLLPCLHDLSCVLMCVGSLWPLCRDIGLALRAGDICFAVNVRDRVFLSSPGKRTHFKRDLVQLVHRRIHTINTDRAQRRICRKKDILRQKSELLNYSKVCHWLLMRGIIPVKPTAAQRAGTCLAERTMDQYFASSAKWHSVASVIDVQNDNYSLFRNKLVLNGMWWNYTFINGAT